MFWKDIFSRVFFFVYILYNKYIERETNYAFWIYDVAIGRRLSSDKRYFFVPRGERDPCPFFVFYQISSYSKRDMYAIYIWSTLVCPFSFNSTDDSNLGPICRLRTDVLILNDYILIIFTKMYSTGLYTHIRIPILCRYLVNYWLFFFWKIYSFC